MSGSCKSIILNSSNWNSSYNAFVYSFPISTKIVKSSVGLASISFYNSFFNVSSSYGNNTISINYSGTNYNWTLPSGYYSMSDLNYFLQSQMIANNLYMINSSGQYVYFLEIVANSVLYSGQINVYPVPNSSTATTLSYTLPSGGSYGTNNCPSITISTAFGNLIGFASGTYGGGVSTLTTATQYLSSKCPIISLVNSLILTTNLINNIGFSNPTNVLCSVPLLNGFGSLCTQSGQEVIYQRCSDNHFSSISVQVLDQNLNVLTPFDNEFTIILALRTDTDPNTI